MLHNTQFFPEYNLNDFGLWSALIAIGIYYEPKNQLSIYAISRLNIKVFFSVNMLKTVLKFYQLHLMLFSLIRSLNSRQLSVMH